MAFVPLVQSTAAGSALQRVVVLAQPGGFVPVFVWSRKIYTFLIPFGAYAAGGSMFSWAQLVHRTLTHLSRFSGVF